MSTVLARFATPGMRRLRRALGRIALLCAGGIAIGVTAGWARDSDFVRENAVALTRCGGVAATGECRPGNAIALLVQRLR